MGPPLGANANRGRAWLNLAYRYSLVRRLVLVTLRTLCEIISGVSCLLGILSSFPDAIMLCLLGENDDTQGFTCCSRLG